MKSSMPFLIEVVASTVDSCIAAESGGAGRIELCTALATAGLTPGAPLLRAVKRAVKIPVVVMIRPREGDFCYSRDELNLMKAEIDSLGEAGADGFVFGVLNKRSEIDISATTDLVRCCGNQPAVFHRAIDCTKNLLESVEQVKQTGCIRILTSGGAASGVDGIGKIVDMQRVAGNDLTLMPGGGLRPESFERVLRKELSEYHLSGRSLVQGATDCQLFDLNRYETDAHQIRTVATLCEKFYLDD
jgi:copper homeostasis protein